MVVIMVGIMDTLTDTDTTEENDLPMLSQKQKQMPKPNLGTDMGMDTADITDTLTDTGMDTT